MTDHIVLDLDGPVLDGKARHYNCYREILAENDCNPLPVDTYWDLKRDRTPLPEILEQTGAEHILQTFQQRWLSRIEDMEFLAFDRAWPGVEAVLKNVRQKGRIIILLTKRQSKTNVLQQIENIDLACCFDQVIVTGLDQQKSEMLKLQSPGTDFAGAIWIGDTELDIQEARKTGALAWTVTCGLRSTSFLKRYEPDRMFPDLCSALRELP